ncbi:MAG: M3 family peptidase, partial [Eudoraea sp.]
MNPLLTPFDTAPFSRIKNEHFMPAFQQAMENARKEIDEITNSEEEPTFENTIEALEFSGQHLERIASLFFNLNSAETNDTIQKIAQEVSPLLSEFNNDIILNEKLFRRVKNVFENKEKYHLTVEQDTLLDKKYKNFSRNGANLN